LCAGNACCLAHGKGIKRPPLAIFWILIAELGLLAQATQFSPTFSPSTPLDCQRLVDDFVDYCATYWKKQQINLLDSAKNKASWDDAEIQAAVKLDI
jgi:hypothetical protein